MVNAITDTNDQGKTPGNNAGTGDSFFISESAAKRLLFLKSHESDTSVNLRIEVLGGGCSGFQYKYNFDNKENEDDRVFTDHGAKVIIDKTSLGFVSGSTLDYVETLGAASFEIKNPNATANCGCGNSFAV